MGAKAENFMKKYKEINKDNITDIIREEIGLVFSEVLENAGVYKCDEAGRAAFMKFITSVS